MMDIKGGLLLWFMTFFYKKSADSSVNMHTNNERPLDLAEELHKPIIRKLKKKKFIQDLKTIFGLLI